MDLLPADTANTADHFNSSSDHFTGINHTNGCTTDCNIAHHIADCCSRIADCFSRIADCCSRIAASRYKCYHTSTANQIVNFGRHKFNPLGIVSLLVTNPKLLTVGLAIANFPATIH